MRPLSRYALKGVCTVGTCYSFFLHGTKQGGVLGLTAYATDRASLRSFFVAIVDRFLCNYVFLFDYFNKQTRSDCRLSALCMGFSLKVGLLLCDKCRVDWKTVNPVVVISNSEGSLVPTSCIQFASCHMQAAKLTKKQINNYETNKQLTKNKQTHSSHAWYRLAQHLFCSTRSRIIVRLASIAIGRALD